MNSSKRDPADDAEGWRRESRIDSDLGEPLASFPIRPAAEKATSRPRIWTFSTVIVICVGLTGAVEYSMIMPSMATYVDRLGGNSVLYGVGVGVFSLARVCNMPVLGYWSDRRPMVEPLVFSLLVSICGNFCYAIAEWVGSVWLIIVGRLIVGVGAANNTVTMSYVTRLTDGSNRTKTLAMINGLNLLGIVLGPATNAFVQSVNVQLWNNGPTLDEATNPGWFMIVLLLLLLVLVVGFFREPPSLTKANIDSGADGRENAEVLPGDGRRKSGESDGEVPSPLVEQLSVKGEANDHHETSAQFARLARRGVIVSYCVSWTNNFTLSSLETCLPVMTSRSFGWDVLENALMYTVIGVAMAVAIVLVIVLSKRYSDKTFILFGTILLGFANAAGMALLYPKRMHLASFIVCSLLLIYSIPVMGNPNLAHYSKQVQSVGAGDKMGLFLGFLQAVNGLSRSVAPIYGGWALSFDTHAVAYAGPLVFWVMSMVAIMCNWSYLSNPLESRGSGDDEGGGSEVLADRPRGEFLVESSNDLESPLLR